MAAWRAFALTLAVIKATSAFRLLPGSVFQVKSPGNGDPCGEFDCPDFDLKASRDGYVVRSYSEALWAYRNISGSGFTVAEGKGFEALLRYFGGANVDEEVMGSSEPAITLFRPKDGFNGVENDFTVSFYLPERYQAGRVPPDPLTDDVRLYKAPPSVAYVSNFTGFALEGAILTQARALRDKLIRDNVEFIQDWFWFATYSPYKQIFHRYNEIWFSKPPATDSFPATAVQLT